MSGSQLPLFQRKTYKGIIPTIPVTIQAPGAEKTVLETLPAYHTYLQNGGFSQYTPDDFTGSGGIGYGFDRGGSNGCAPASPDTPISQSTFV